MDHETSRSAGLVPFRSVTYNQEYHFPFSDPLKMKTILTDDLMQEIRFRISDGADPLDFRMPLGKPALSKENQELLLRYLDSIQHLN